MVPCMSHDISTTGATGFIIGLMLISFTDAMGDKRRMVQKACESGTWRSAIKPTFLDKLNVPSDKGSTHFLAKNFHYVSGRGATLFD